MVSRRAKQSAGHAGGLLPKPAEADPLWLLPGAPLFVSGCYEGSST